MTSRCREPPKFSEYPAKTPMNLRCPSAVSPEAAGTYCPRRLLPDGSLWAPSPQWLPPCHQGFIAPRVSETQRYGKYSRVGFYKPISVELHVVGRPRPKGRGLSALNHEFINIALAEGYVPHSGGPNRCEPLLSRYFSKLPRPSNHCLIEGVNKN